MLKSRSVLRKSKIFPPVTMRGWNILLFRKVTGSTSTALHTPEADGTTRQGSSSTRSRCDGAFLIRRDPLLLTEFRNRQRVSSDIFKCVIICVTQFVFRVNRIRVVWLGANFSVCIWVADGIGPPDENESKPRPREYIETSLRVLSWFVSTANGLRIVLHILIFSSQFEMKRSYVLSGCSYGRR